LNKHLRNAVLLASAVVVNAQQSPVPVEEEPHHHVVLKNEWVEVMHVTLPPGERTLYHTHSHDRAAIGLTTGAITQQKFGEEEGKSEPTKTGQFWLGALDAPYSHSVHNVGEGPFEVLDVEFLQRPKDASANPAAEVAAENPSARAYNWVLAPGASSAQHTHERPYLIVAVTGMKLKMTGADGQFLAHEVKPGDFHWVEAKVTHTLTNESAVPGQIVEIELK
jgi:quercetin dioxygenase-like cupin family protein